jgi:ketosteroid isomerase-like protein
MAGSRAVSDREPGQVRKEAALSGPAHAPRTNLAGAKNWRARPKTHFDDGCTVHSFTMPIQEIQLMRRATDRFNAGDLDGFADMLVPDATMTPDPSWPEQGPFVGREAVMGFVGTWVEDWESVQLEVDGMEERGEWVVSRCRWLTEGRASGVAQEVSFTFVIRPEGDRIAAIKAFFDHDEALRSLA